VLFSDGPTLKESELPAEFKERATGGPGAASPAAPGEPPRLPIPAEIPPEGASLKEIVRFAAEALERDLIGKALAQTGGNVTQAADKLKISRKTLQTKMKELGLRESDERPTDES
jgi:DNA-binding NtrC family response regulator